MKNLFLLLLLATFTSVSVQAQGDEEPTLTETLEWLEGKLESFKYSRFISGDVLSRGYWDKYTYKMSFDECELTIEEHYSYVKDNNNSRHDYDRDNVYVFELSKLKSIEWEDNYGNGYFIIKTYNDKKVITKNDNTIQNELRIYANDLGEIKGEPERFLKAFRHAMELCGAKKEKF